MSFGESYQRREHAGGTPKVERNHDEWISTCDFPYEVLHDFAHEEPEQYPIEKFGDTLKQIALWITNDGKFQERGLADRAMVFAFMIVPGAVNCATQAELAEKMKLSRSQVNEYVNQFTEQFGFVCGATYSERQRKARRKSTKSGAGPSAGRAKG